MKEGKYFVYVQGLNGPEPQKWSRDLTTDGKPTACLFKVEISDATFYDVSLNELMLLHPYEAK